MTITDNIHVPPGLLMKKLLIPICVLYLKMKRFLMFLFLMAFISIGHSQKVKINSEKRIVIDSVVYFDTLSVNEIYNAVKKWSVSSFVNVKEVTVYDIPEEVQFRYVQNVDNGYGFTPINTTITIKIKKGKMRIEFANMSWRDGGTLFESVYLKNDGTLRDNKPCRTNYFSIESNFKLCVDGIAKNLKEPKDSW